MSSTIELKDRFDKRVEWFKNRTPLERKLLTIFTFTIILALVLIITIAVISSKLTNEKTCTSPGCIHAASTALKFMDRQANPCEDFYQFACGGFMKTMAIPDDEKSADAFMLSRDVVRDQLKILIEEPVDKDAPRPYHMLQDFYRLCMNTTAIEDDGLKTAKFLLRKLGGWPLLDGDRWKEDWFDWKEIMYASRQLGFPINIFSFSITVDYKNSSRYIISLDEPSLGIGREFIIKGLENKIVRTIYEFTVDVAVIFGANRKRALMEIRDGIEFLIKVAKIATPQEERRNYTTLYNLMTIKEMQHKYPSVPWYEYITKIIGISDIKITDDEEILVSSPDFLTKYLDLIKQTPKRILANNLLTGAATFMVPYLNKELRDRATEMMKSIVGSQEKEPRWKECGVAAQNSFHLAMGSLYVRKHFDKDAKKVAEEMVLDIKQQFMKTLQEIDWMNGVTRRNALEKVEAMSAHIGYPDELLNDQLIEEFYQKLDLSSDNYLEAILRLNLFVKDYKYRKLRTTVNKNDWITHSLPTVVNAMYSSTENSIAQVTVTTYQATVFRLISLREILTHKFVKITELPAAIFQGVFFNHERPKYMNYGAIGSTIGHEITHGFDDQGRQFDKNGNLNNWWEEHTINAFKEKAQCIIDQYGNYTIPELGVNLNGINTQGENIADNGGVIQSYLAYQSWVDRNGAEPNLPGFEDYTPNQMFWISAASVECSKVRKEALLMNIIDGAHSPGMFRVNGPFSNTELFSKDFDCPLGSKMNPVKKCRVW